MRYIFYADVYFIQNFMIKVAVLYLAMSCNKLHVEFAEGIGKICVASILGTMIEIIGLLYSGTYTMFVLGVHILEVPLLTWFVCGKASGQLLRMILSGYFFMILINGVLEMLWNIFGEKGSYIFFLMFSCGVVLVGTRMWRNYARMKKGIFLVELISSEKRLQVKAFYDSGNRLVDPYTKKGIHIVSEQVLANVGILRRDEQAPTAYVPFQSLGNEADLLEVYYVDALIIEGEKERIHISNSPLGVTKDKLFEGRDYQIILNEEVF